MIRVTLVNMTRVAATFALVIALTTLTAPVQAADEPQTLTRSEVGEVVDHLLRVVIGPAVASAGGNGRIKVRVWGCEVHDDVKGSCRGHLVAGGVTCTGLFRVGEKVRVYNAWPAHMNCRS